MNPIQILKEAALGQVVTANDISNVKKALDALFKNLGMDVQFTKHFEERCNDARNGKQITVAELLYIFRMAYQKFGPRFAQMPSRSEGVIKDANSMINIPVGFTYNPSSKMLELRVITIMRKRNFVPNNSRDPVFNI